MQIVLEIAAGRNEMIRRTIRVWLAHHGVLFWSIILLGVCIAFVAVVIW